MKDYIMKDKVYSLQNAIMEFPTWDLLKGLIAEETSLGFPLINFGKKPMTKPDKTIIPVIGTTSLTKGHEYIGFDAPVLLRPLKGGLGKTIVIVGETPLREMKDFNNPDIILLGTPFAIHQEFDKPSRCNIYKEIFSGLLAKGYNVYITDIIKVWWKGKKKNNMKANDTDKELFRKEIDRIKKEKGELGKDVFIVAWGKTAENELNNLEEYTNKFKAMLHPGHLNWNNWKLHIFEKAIYEKKDMNYVTKIYPDSKCTTTEVVVANEAVKEILEWVKKNHQPSW